MKRLDFSKGVESLVDPVSVGSIHFIQSLNQLLPKSIQRSLVKSSGSKTPYMGFVVEPYSFFLCYEITDIERAAALLPAGFKLIKSQVFEGDEPRYYCLFGTFRAHTSAFWGARTEFYVIAEDEKTGLLTWIIVDYVTDTISYDNKHGLRAPNSVGATVTTTYAGKLLVDMKDEENGYDLTYSADLKTGQTKKLDERLWLEGNLSIGYGSKLSESGDVFSLKFEEGEVAEAVEMPLSSLSLEQNTWYPGLFADKPARLVCFPYAQHFVSDSPGHASNIKNKSELSEAIKKIDFENITVMSADSFKKMFMVGALVSAAITLTLLVLLILK